MANNEDKLSRLYREGLGDFVKDPPPQVWSGIKQGILIRKLVTFKFMTSLNIYSVAVFITVAAIAGFIVGKQLQQKNNSLTTSKNISSIVTKIPDESQKAQNINLKQEQNIEKAKVSNQQEISSIKHNHDAVQPNVFSESIYPVIKPVNVQKNVINPSSQNDNIIKQNATFTEKPIIIDSSKMFIDEINPDILKKSSSEKNIIIDQKNNPPDQPKIQSEPTTENIIARKPKTTQGFYADIFGAPSLLTYKFKQSTINPSLTFVNTSKDNEKPALSYTAGLELGYSLKHLLAQSGINYSDYRSKTMIDLYNSYLIQTYNIRKKDSTFLYQDSSGKHYSYIFDSIPVQNSKDTQISHRSTNSLRYIEIPILIGYRYYGKRMSYAVLGGISLGYLFSSGGQTINPDLKSVTTNTPDAVPLKVWTYYFVFRAEAAYLLSKDICFFIRPGFKYNINSVFEDYYPVQKTFYALDLHLGLRYIF